MPIYKGNTKIVKLYKGTTQIVKRYKGTDLIYSASRLPSAFQEVEYLESTGTQYIDSGVIGKYGVSTYTKVNILSGVSENVRLLGSRIGSGDTRYYVGYSQYLSSINFGYMTDNPSAVSPTPNVINEYEYIAENGKLIIKENGITILSNTTSDTTFTTNLSMFVFGNNHSGSLNNPIKAKLYSLKIYDNNTLVRNFVPCYRKADNVAGLYDLVNGVFYTNAGTGTFIVGGNV